MDIDLVFKTPYIQNISLPVLKHRNITLSVLRLDSIHHVVSGNKWFKLKQNFKVALENKASKILTFGGPYSNHLISAAYTAAYYKIPITGCVRGENWKNSLTSTLIHAKSLGMDLQFLNKVDYALLSGISEKDDYSNTLNSFVIPEGGSNILGVSGAEEIASFIPSDSDFVCCAIGSGTTFKGISNRLSNTQTLQGYIPMKQGKYLDENFQQQISSEVSWTTFDDYHFGGFGKYNHHLITFMNDIFISNHLPLDMVYTSKMLFGILDQIEKDMFPDQSKILMIHSGGLQGNQSIQNLLIF